MRIRMYRQGLGDCFLLSFPGADRETHVLIDCGVLLGTAGQEQVMLDVARDVREATGSRLDIVAVTHEHWDHVSGFLQAAEELDAIDVGEVWMAWTENPADAEASQLAVERHQRVERLNLAVKKWEGAQVRPAAAGAAREILGFFGEGLAAIDGPTTAKAMQALRTKYCDRLRFLDPGEVMAIPGTSDARAFVLGPPRDLKLLRKDRPTASSPETYDEERFMLAAVDRGVGPGSAPDPFDPYYRVQNPRVRGRPVLDSYFAPANSWRRIDGDWLATAGELALNLDSDTNNTSLVLAFEAWTGGPVLLMVGDAQVGNWLSWQALSWALPGPGKTERTVTADDLLGRTVVYKVGHHGSHNATLRGEGLERMSGRDLMALVPVHRDTARKKGWRMPFPPLLAALEQSCRGRVVLLDAGRPDATSAAFGRISFSERQQFMASVTETKLFIEVQVGPVAQAAAPRSRRGRVGRAAAQAS
jgi:hypothetical protein